jgi:hypothetical protein
MGLRVNRGLQFPDGQPALAKNRLLGDQSARGIQQQQTSSNADFWTTLVRRTPMIRCGPGITYHSYLSLAMLPFQHQFLGRGFSSNSAGRKPVHAGRHWTRFDVPTKAIRSITVNTRQDENRDLGKCPRRTLGICVGILRWYSHASAVIP